VQKDFFNSIGLKLTYCAHRTVSTPRQVVIAQGEVAVTLAGDLENGIGDAGLL
jgi:hypothetical protein